MMTTMLSEAWRAMSANRLRTFLTMLGMVIGVGAVILMLAVGRGAQFMVEQSIASMGSNLFIVLSGSSSAGGVRLGAGAAPTLTVGDAQAIGELPTISTVAPSLPGSAQLGYAANNWSTSVMGTTPSFLEVRDWQVANGCPCTDSDVRAGTRGALLGLTVGKNLFGDDDPVGKTLRIRQSPFLVVGVLAQNGQSLDGRDQDDTVLITVTTAQNQLFGNQFQGSVRFLLTQGASAGVMAAAAREMTELLRQRHHIQEETENDFTIRNLTAVATTAAQTTQVMSLMLGAIASISQVVGGIGIMNIMLVSVTERARDILLQFLLEAIIISIAGCLVGVLLGVGGALLINQLTDTAVVITGGAIMMAFAVASAIGVFFGYYPAHQAARLKPIDALRYQ